MPEPNSIIKLIKNCKIDCDYTNTILFESPEQQKGYFYNSTDGYFFNNQSYQRYANGEIVVNKKCDDLYMCNYMMFQNTNYSNKWFYAFITNMEYVGENATRVFYELDVIQTYLFEVIPQACFVEREHSVTDNIGDNLVGENLYFGEYVYGDEVQPIDDSGAENMYMWQLSTVLVFNSSFLQTIISRWANLEPYLYGESLYSGVYQGVTFFVIPTYLGGEIVDMVNEVISATDFLTFGGFVCGFMIPHMFVPTHDSIPEFTNINKAYLFRLSRPNNINGYTPKNKKLFTYPYVCGELTNKRGTTNEVKYEYSNLAGTLHFKCEGNFSLNPNVIAYPANYKGLMSYFDAGVSVGGYPTITWGADGVTEWVNNNLLKTAITAPLTLGQNKLLYTWSKATRLSLSGTVNDVINASSSFLGSGDVHGGVDGDVMLGSSEGNYIVARQKFITKQYAQIIDNYFDRFGYATNLTKVPNRNSRPHWNYVKTLGFTFDGAVPADSAKKIISIYDNGITFWKNSGEIGDYTLDNSV